MSDLLYFQNGFYTRFVPNTKEGEDAWNEIYRVTGDGAVRNDHLKATLKQLRTAGYKVTKGKVTKAQRQAVLGDIDNLFGDLLY